jgi:hypothetical protein
LCRLLEIADPSNSDYRQIAGRRHFGRDGTVGLNLSGLESVTADSR